MKRTLKPGTMLYPLPAVLVTGGDMENSTLMTAAWTGIVNSDPPMDHQPTPVLQKRAKGERK